MLHALASHALRFWFLDHGSWPVTVHRVIDFSACPCPCPCPKSGTGTGTHTGTKLPRQHLATERLPWFLVSSFQNRVW
ncbi:MAG: hypothetical protein RBS57_20690, partial [Desulforhabdus sp.]|nr:hypothetical protein [Desulforhabdus sp.]